jgi:hypothetical protein
VRLIEDDDAILALVRGARLNLGRQQPCVVDTTIGGSVNLFDIKRMRLLEDGVLLAAGGGDLTAVDADAARLLRGALRCADRRRAVQSCGEDAGDRGLADTAMAGEDVAMRNASLRKRVEQGTCDVVLPDHVGEELRAVLAC